MLHIRQQEILTVTRHVLAGFILTVALATIPAPAGAITLEELKGLSLELRANYNMRVRRAEGDFSTQATRVIKVKIDGEGRILGQTVRTVTTARGPRVRTHPVKARIGTPGTPDAGGEGLWLIDGDKLILLRTFDTGGFKGEVEFKGSGSAMTCTFRAPFLREEGKQNVRMQKSVVGGPVSVLSATQTGSGCKITR
jgi:hypothetical protein